MAEDDRDFWRSKREYELFPRRRSSAAMYSGQDRAVDEVADFEFGEYGRHPRFLAGWWILPTSLFGGTVLIFLARLLV